MTRKEQLKMLRPLRLVIDYYKYFLNLDIIKGAYVEGSCRWDSMNRTYVYGPLTITIRKYKTSKRRTETDRLRTLIEFCPDIVCVPIEQDNKWSYKYEVNKVNPKLNSIKNNTLGLERED